MAFLRTNIMTLFSKVICLAAALFISIYIARYIGPSAKGIYYLLIQIISILATISVFGIDTASIYFLGKAHEARKVVGISNVLTVVISVFAAVCLFLMANLPFFNRIIPQDGRNYFYAVILIIPLISMARLNSAILSGFSRYFTFNLMNIILFLTLTLTFLVFVIILKLGLAGAFASYILTYLILSAVYLIVVLTSRQMSKPSGRHITAQTLLGYSSKVFLVPLLLLVIYRIDSFFLGYYSDVSKVGFYSVALSFAELLLFIPESTCSILFPTLAHTKAEEVDKKFAFILKVSVILTVTAAAIFFITIKYLLPFFYGKVYAQSVNLVYILLPGLAAISTYYIFASYFMAIGRPGVISATLGLILLEKAVFCWILIPRYEALGAAIASLVSYLTCFLIFFASFYPRVRGKVHEMFVLNKSEMNIIRNSLTDIFDFQK